MSRQSSRRSLYDGAVPESLGSVGVGGGWQLAWQKDGEEGALKRVYLKSEAGDLSNVTTQTLSGVPGFGNFLGDQESFPVIPHVIELFQFVSLVQWLCCFISFF